MKNASSSINNVPFVSLLIRPVFTLQSQSDENRRVKLCTWLYNLYSAYLLYYLLCYLISEYIHYDAWADLADFLVFFKSFSTFAMSKTVLRTCCLCCSTISRLFCELTYPLRKSKLFLQIRLFIAWDSFIIIKVYFAISLHLFGLLLILIVYQHLYDLLGNSGAYFAILFCWMILEVLYDLPFPRVLYIQSLLNELCLTLWFSVHFID